MLIRFWDFFEEQAGGILLLLSVLLVFGQILARSVFDVGLSGLYELASYCAIYSVFLTSSVAIKNNTHIRIDLLANVVSPKAAYGLEIVAMLIVATVCAALFWSGVLVVMESYMLGDRTIGTISMAVWMIQMILPIAGALMFLRAAQRIWMLMAGGLAAFKLVDASEIEFL